MAARLKGYRKFKDETEHDTGITFETYVSSKNGEFKAAWGNFTMNGTVYRDLVQSFKKLIRAENQLEFFPVIVVQEKPPFASQGTPFLSFTFYRCYVAHRPGENRAMAKIEWEDYTGQGDLQVYKHRLRPPGDFRFRIGKLPYSDYPLHRDGGSYVFEYNEALWEGLKKLYAQVENMQDRFRALLGTKQGIQLITQVGSGTFLESGEEETE